MIEIVEFDYTRLQDMLVSVRDVNSDRFSFFFSYIIRGNRIFRFEVHLYTCTYIRLKKP